MPVCPRCSQANPEGFRFCGTCGAPLVEEKIASDERKVATVLFADLVGSTEFGDSQDPERTRALLERFYDGMAAEIEAAGGTLEKFVGDAVMAAFGVPAAQEDHAERALHAALGLQRRLEELFGDTLALRIGVNTGEVIAGRAREGSSFVTGDAVNVAARIEQAAAPGEILVGERTAATVRGAFELAEPMMVEAKGKEGGVACRRLVRPLSLMRPRGVGGLQRTFVGREHELELLQGAYRRAADRQEPQLMTVMGDAGVGKTRLAREFWEWLGAESPQPLRRTGRCLSYGHGITYWPFGEVLKEQFAILESDPPESLLRRLGERKILALTLGLDVAGDLHPLAARERLEEAWVELLGELAAERPLVVLVEDLHWAEEPLLDLLDRLVRAVQGPLLLLATARPDLAERRSTRGRRADVSNIWLEALTPASTARMLEQLLAAELPPGLRDVVVERAEGNPFFVEELVGTLIDQGVLERANGSWTAEELPAGFVVPDTVQAVLAARIDLLRPADKAALQAASVIGRIFWSGPVYELLEGLEPDLRLLEERDFIRRRSGSSMAGEREYAIKHALTREVAYGSLPKAKRAHLHASFAAWLERIGDARDEHASLLAHHYAEAVRTEVADLAWATAEDELARLRGKALFWLRRAADLAVGRYAIDDALALLERARELEASETGQADLWEKIAHANMLKFDGEAFWTAMQEAIALTSDRGILADLYSTLAYETTTRPAMWRLRPDRSLVKGWVERALELSDPGTPARAKALMAVAEFDPERGAEPALEASELAERLGDAYLRSEAASVRAELALMDGRYEEAHALALQRFELLADSTDPEARVNSHWYAVCTNLGAGRVDEARRHARLLDEVSRELSSHHAVHGISMSLMVEELQAHWEVVRGLAADTERRIADNAATPCQFNVRSLLVCAVASAYAGDEAEARRLETEADALGIEGYGLTNEAPRIRLALIRGELDRVERLLAELREAMYFTQVAGQATRLDALAALGDRKGVEDEALPLLRSDTFLEPFALRALGLVRENAELVARAIARFDALGLDRHAEETRGMV